MSRDYYARDWKCFHCGDIGHRAGWFCPLVRKSQSQTGRGAQAYAEYQKKYAKEIKPYNINEILEQEKQFWEKKGKDIQQMVHNYVKQSLTKNTRDNRSSLHSNNNNKRVSFKHNNNNRNNNLKDIIKNNRDRIMNRNRNITDLTNDNHSSNNNNDDSDDVQELHNNCLYIHDDTPENIYSDAFNDNIISHPNVHLNIINDNMSSYNNDIHNDQAVIHQLDTMEKQYAYPLLVQVELNDKQQNVLLDQGATRNLCRRSTLNKYYPNIYQDILSSKCSLISSSGTVMPITSRVKLTVRISDNDSRCIILCS